MCSGIRVPLREVGLLPGGYGTNSPSSKILWDKEDIILGSCPENDASFYNHVVSYSLFGNPQSPYVTLIQWFSTGVFHALWGTFGSVGGAVLVVTPGMVLLALSECKAQIPLNILQCTSQVPTTKNTQPKTPVVPRMRTPSLM